MIACHGLYGLLNGFAHLEAFLLNGGLELWCETVDDATHEADREVGTLIVEYVATDETAELIGDELLDGLMIYVACQEWNEGGEEEVGLWLAIDSVDDLCLSETQFVVEGLEQRGWQLALEDIAHQTFAQAGSTAFVAQDKAQGRCLLHYFLSVEKAGVGSSAEYAGDALLMSAEGYGCAHHVALHLDLGLWEIFLQNMLDCGGIGRDAACSVEIDLTDATLKAFLDLGYDLADDIFLVAYGIDTCGLNDRTDVASLNGDP